MKNIIKIVLGWLALIMGLVGIIVPILPTTPFILVSVWCFSSTPKLKKKLLSIPIIKEYYLSYTKKSGLKKGTVIRSLLFLWVMLIISSVLINKTTTYIILPIVGVLVSIHIILVSRPKNRETDNEKIFTP